MDSMKMILAAAVLVLGACEGPMGPQGAMGVPGVPGANGANGAAGPQGETGATAPDGSKITSTYFCFATLEGTQLNFNYYAQQFADGNVYATASVYTLAQQGGASALYSPQQNGASYAGVSFVFDVFGTASGGYWLISLNRATLITTIQFFDSEVPPGVEPWTPRTWIQLPQDCGINVY